MNFVEESKLAWGGAWTNKKLDAFANYVAAYLKILKRQPQWRTIYFDGFAGSGVKKTKKTELYNQLSITKDEEDVYKGSAERVLSMDQAFDYCYFIDTDEKALQKLEKRLGDISGSESVNLQFRTGDCNKWLKELSKALKTNEYAALILLDPFGMQIEWDSIAELRGTRSDIWILIPTGVIVNRLLERSGELKQIKTLEKFFGLTEDEIRKEFYHTDKMSDLFGDETEIVTKVVKPINQIAKVYFKQLKTVWKFVTEEPLRLDNTKNVPIFHLVFASNNKTAIKIASHIIKPR